MDRVDADRLTSEGPWRCQRCGHEGTLRVFAAVTVVNARAVRAGAPLEGAIQPAGEREAERNARLANALAKCPACRRRPAGPHRRFVAQVVGVGVIVGVGLAVATVFVVALLAMASGHDPGVDSRTLEALAVPAVVIAFAFGMLTTASAIYLRRLANVARWGKFVA